MRAAPRASTWRQLRGFGHVREPSVRVRPGVRPFHRRAVGIKGVDAVRERFAIDSSPSISSVATNTFWDRRESGKHHRMGDRTLGRHRRETLRRAATANRYRATSTTLAPSRRHDYAAFRNRADRALARRSPRIAVTSTPRPMSQTRSLHHYLALTRTVGSTQHSVSPGNGSDQPALNSHLSPSYINTSKSSLPHLGRPVRSHRKGQALRPGRRTRCPHTSGCRRFGDGVTSRSLAIASRHGVVVAGHDGTTGRRQDGRPSGS